MELLLIALLSAAVTLTVMAVAGHAWALWTLRQLDRSDGNA